MTVELKAMMELRDLQVARDIARRAEMGWFDVEFTMYGCCYFKNNQCYYRLSAEAEKIYSFLEKGRREALFPSDMMTLTKRCPVPVGMKDYLAKDIKMSLAQRMQQAFPREFFSYLEETAELATEESAFPILIAQWESVEGYFDEERLRHFQMLLDFTCACRKITTAQYQQISEWVAEERQSMVDNPLAKDIFEKTFYAMMYETPAGFAYLANACSAQIYQQKYRLEHQGIFVSPVFSKTYWYNYTLRLPAVRQLFEQAVQQFLTPDYLAMLRTISRHNDKLSNKAFAERTAKVAAQFGEQAALTFRHYGYRWGIL